MGRLRVAAHPSAAAGLGLCGSRRGRAAREGIAMAERPKRAAKKVERPATGLAAVIKTAPTLSAPKAVHARVAEWLGAIARTASGEAIKQILAPARPTKLSDVVAAVAEASPYLWDLIRADPPRFLALLEADPKAISP